MFLAFYHRAPHIGNIFYTLCGYTETGLTRIVRDNARIAQEQICTSILVINRYRSTHAEKGWEIIFHEFHYVGNCTPTFRNFTLLLDILIFLFFLLFFLSQSFSHSFHSFVSFLFHKTHRYIHSFYSFLLFCYFSFPYLT